jgi:hypothetical protein
MAVIPFDRSDQTDDALISASADTRSDFAATRTDDFAVADFYR